MIVKRDLFYEVSKYIEAPEAIVVTGVRRVGKTTLLKYIFDNLDSNNKLFLDLEDPMNQNIFEERNYEKIKLNLEKAGIDLTQRTYVFLDEIQNMKNIPSIVKYLLDHHKIKFFLTGSASFYLKDLFSESLAGRKYVFELYPLSFEEFLVFKNINYKIPGPAEEVTTGIYGLFAPLYEEYMTYGGFPQVVLKESFEEKNKTLGDIFSSYFQKEVLQLADFRSNSGIRKLILLLAERVGQKIDIQKISSELGITRPTVYSYLEFLRGTYFIDLVYPLGKSDVSLRKQAKIYFVDTGLLRHVGDISTGSAFENSCFLKLRRKGGVNYYSKRTDEIDFVQKGYAFESKIFGGKSDLKALARVSSKVGLNNYFLFSLRHVRLPKTIYGFTKI